MNTTDTDRALLLALVTLAVAIEALALLLRPLVAHGLALALTLAGWRPSPARSASEAPQGRREADATHPITRQPRPAAGGQLEALPVRELRVLARAAGHRSLARSGRRADLLMALA